MTVDQVERLKDPNIQTWANEESEGGDPPRLWVQNGMYPGTAFTRSVGDCTAEGIGVTAEPEVSMVHLSPNHLFFVVASDGIFEFLPSQAVVDMVGRYADPRDGCAAATAESYKLWLEHENRTDDITIIISFFVNGEVYPKEFFTFLRLILMRNYIIPGLQGSNVTLESVVRDNLSKVNVYKSYIMFVAIEIDN
ncbi:hypothetical protein YC2023_006469 [Brassica napus]